MPQTIKVFSDGSTLEYDQGRFDNWCVYLARLNKNRYAPRDINYFNSLKKSSQIYGSDKIYNDFVEIYNKTTSIIDSSVLSFITKISTNYVPDNLEMDILFTILYAGMVAEENKENTKLRKRIKRLGLHQVLIED